MTSEQYRPICLQRSWGVQNTNEVRFVSLTKMSGVGVQRNKPVQEAWTPKMSFYRRENPTKSLLSVVRRHARLT